MELVKKAKEIPESPDEKLIEDIIDHKDPWDEPRLLLSNDSDGTILSTGDPHRCLKCGGQGKPSKALLDEMARLCTEDALELGGHIEVPSGAVKMVNCTKCESCGHSWVENSRKKHNKPT